MNKDLCLLMFFYLHRKETIGMGCSQAVRQRFLVACTVGSNPTTPATHFPKFEARAFSSLLSRNFIALPLLVFAWESNYTALSTDIRPSSLFCISTVRVWGLGRLDSVWVSRILFDQKPLFGPPTRNAPFDQNVRCGLQRQSSGDDLLQNVRR